MANELEIADISLDNAANTNFAPYTVVDLDATNSNAVSSAAVQATTATEVLGVCYDQSHLNPEGSVTANSAIAVRTWGIARVVTSAAVNAGAFVSVSNTSGQVATAAQTAGGSQPKPIVGRALTSTSNAGDRALVLLMIGARY